MGHVFADFREIIGPLLFVAVLIISGIVNSQREKAKREKERRTLQENLDTREKRTETYSIPVARPRQQQTRQIPSPRQLETPPPLRPVQPSPEQAKPISVQDLLNTMLGGAPVITPKNPPPIQPQQRQEPVQRPQQRQAPPKQAAPQRRPVQTAPPQARPVAAQLSSAPRPMAAQQAAPKRVQRRKKQGVFLGSLDEVRRGIVLREVLGPPKAFTDWPE